MLVAAASLVALLVPSNTFASTTSTVELVDPGGTARMTFKAGGHEINNVTVSLSGGDYVLTDSASPITPPGSPCSAVDANTVSCPASMVKKVSVYTGGQNDTVNMNVAPPNGTYINGGTEDDILNGGPGDDTMLGGAGGDTMNGGAGDDVMNSGPVLPLDGSIPDAATCFDLGTQQCFDALDGQSGFDTVTYADRHGPIKTDLRVGRTFGMDDDGTNDSLAGFESVIGGFGNDEIVGSQFNDTLSGGPGGADTICGGLGIDTVDYSDSPGPVHVTLKPDTTEAVITNVTWASGTATITYAGAPGDGSWGSGLVHGDSVAITGTGTLLDNTNQLVASVVDSTHFTITVSDPGDYIPTNPRVRIDLPTDPNIVSLDQAKASTAREDCRPVDGLGQPIDGVSRDCTADDGLMNPTTGQSIEHDCVGEDVENVIGSSHDDILVGNDPDPLDGLGPLVEPHGENVLMGGPGDDSLDGGLGADVLLGGSGNDTVTYASRFAPVQASIDGAPNDGNFQDQQQRPGITNGISDQIGPDVENIVGGAGADTLKGDSGPNSLQGGPGNDLLQGGDGNDTLDGGVGNDRLQGGNGDDQLFGGAGDDFLVGGFGADKIIDGGDGTDTVDYSDRTTSVSVTPNGVADDGTAGEGDNVTDTVESVNGGSGDDVLVGNDGNGTIDGGDGDDTLDGGLGSDQIIGGPGFDTVSYASRSAPVSVNLATANTGGEAGENDFISSNVENVTGGSGADTIATGEGANIVTGGPGNDTLSGGNGDDQIFGGPGNDKLSGEGGDDTLAGDDGADNLLGGDGRDTLGGGPGDDLLDGGAGSDVVSGNDGVDTAVYSDRTRAVDITLNGADDDGETNEHDQIRTNVESTTTGAGDDVIDIRDGVKGKATCGRGIDSVVADADDTVASDCENVDRIGISALCSAGSSTVTMSKSGVVAIRVNCPSASRGTVRLETAGKVKVSKKRKLRLGSKSFTFMSGKRATVKVKLSKQGRRAVIRNKRVKAKAILTAKGARASKTSTITIKAPGKGSKKR